MCFAGVNKHKALLDVERQSSSSPSKVLQANNCVLFAEKFGSCLVSAGLPYFTSWFSLSV
ncbi:hypothetical protein I7I50_04316 [Histoplasma capsulatum G186AR]|uniref:Uncharacterized protein n=1 Tax=Ajellomyces capsulatus TaxID=5037 RepID=A0A8H8CX34_AJECA|nr:hypothetical protein I7I52_05224 [Histoplasma capsulatum]QSS75243.1 hypothetical protein I7I50_04316 [Histoplasma capsulatum G186AR]